LLPNDKAHGAHSCHYISKKVISLLLVCSSFFSYEPFLYLARVGNNVILSVCARNLSMSNSHSYAVMPPHPSNIKANSRSAHLVKFIQL